VNRQFCAPPACCMSSSCAAAAAEFEENRRRSAIACQSFFFLSFFSTPPGGKSWVNNSPAAQRIPPAINKDSDRALLVQVQVQAQVEAPHGRSQRERGGPLPRRGPLNKAAAHRGELPPPPLLVPHLSLSLGIFLGLGRGGEIRRERGVAVAGYAHRSGIPRFSRNYLLRT
jgi:hypothetical protein